MQQPNVNPLLTNGILVAVVAGVALYKNLPLWWVLVVGVALISIPYLDLLLAKVVEAQRPRQVVSAVVKAVMMLLALGATMVALQREFSWPLILGAVTAYLLVSMPWVKPGSGK